MKAPEIDLRRARFRSALARHGFEDDGERLLGAVRWRDADGAGHSTPIIVIPDERFPFAPPRVRLDDRRGALATIKPTFHWETVGELAGELCLWDTSASSEHWVDAEKVIARVRGWLEATAAGWPGDDDTDLERYLEPAGRLLVYDSTDIAGRSGLATVTHHPHLLRVRWASDFLPRRGGNQSKRRRVERGGRLAVVINAGELSYPIRNWHELLQVAGRSRAAVRRLVEWGPASVVLVHYRRSGAAGLLALDCSKRRQRPGAPEIRAFESADESTPSRMLRAGEAADELSRTKVALVGCGAVGSFTADLLHRSGVRKMSLYDNQLLRPGNLVRHLAGEAEIGLPKVEAVLERLRLNGSPVGEILAVPRGLTTPEQAKDLVVHHSLVIDATGDERVFGLLHWAAVEMQTTLLSVCLQNDGEVARVDRWPLADGETHADPVPRPAGLDPPLRERGCGDAVSRTPPASVTAAASLAAEAAITVLRGGVVPPTIVEQLGASRFTDRHGTAAAA